MQLFVIPCVICVGSWHFFTHIGSATRHSCFFFPSELNPNIGRNKCFFFSLPLSCRSGKSWSQSRWYWRSRRRPRNCVSKGSLAKRLVFVLYCYSYWILVPCSSERQQIWSRMETTLRPKFIFWCKELTWILNVCQVQIEVIQKRQKEKKAMMNAVKKYQKGEFI